MKIELCEDNGLISENGVPTMVVLLITLENGNKVRVPYDARKTIQDLYADAEVIADAKKFDKFVNPDPQPAIKVGVQIQNTDLIADQAQSLMQTQTPMPNRSSIIEREDIVQCVDLEKDLDGNVNVGREEMVIGNFYRVIDIYKKDRMITHYDVLDDEKNDKIRIPVFPREIKLFKKRIQGPPRKMVFDTIKNCECGEKNVLLLDESINKYVGTCERCGKALQAERPAQTQGV
jgi:hypothetical protein